MAVYRTGASIYALVTFWGTSGTGLNSVGSALGSAGAWHTTPHVDRVFEYARVTFPEVDVLQWERGAEAEPAPAGPTEYFAAATLTGTGSLSAAAKLNAKGVAALSGTGTLTAAGVRTRFAAATLSGAGALTAAGTVTTGPTTHSGAAVLTGAGALTASATVTSMARHHKLKTLGVA